MIDWNFPSNGGGSIRGLADAGIQYFKGREISSLAREICQNSLDAVADENSPVTVEFQSYEVDTKKFPAGSDFVKKLQACKNFWQGKSAKAETFFREAITRMRLSKMSVLRISDFNTMGLSKPFDCDAMEGWNTLTKIDGGATKDGDVGGSFGIGKNAPFANSYCLVVFYRTFNAQGERAAQGVARLVSFRLEDGNVASGVGYYGAPHRNMPVRSIPELDKISTRINRGTDIFIYNFIGENNWHKEIVSELLENFLVAIHRNRLRLKVQGVTLDKNNLRKFVTDNAANYYKILTGDGAVKFFEKDFHGMGKLKLGVLTNPKVKLNRKVLIVRKSGMKLFELDRISRTFSFTAILELEGGELNAFFREMETPAHDKWEPTRYLKNRSLARQRLTELKRWVRETIQSLDEVTDTDEIEVMGLPSMLNSDNGTGDDVIVVTPQPSPKKPKKPKKTPSPQPPQPSPPDGRIRCDKIRVIKVDDKTYRLILKVPKNILRGRIEISAVGESNVGEKLFVMRASSVNSNIQILTVGDEIIFQKLRGDVEAKITFELQDEKNYALGVAVYENRST